jgi:precorrin-6B methylase 2
MSSYGEVSFQRRLVRDRTRSNAYRRAIRRSVRPGDVVLDLGCGTGLLSFFACQAGAARVYAVDNTDILRLAEPLAEHNGWAERVRFLQTDARRLELPERVDVIVSELISKAVIGQRMEELIAHCRDRHLKPGGRLIPQSVQLELVPVSADRAYRELEFPAAPTYRIDFGPVRPWGFNQVAAARFQPRSFLAAPRAAYRFDATSGSGSQSPDTRLRFAITRPATMHGCAAWFSAQLAEGIGLTNRPPGLRAWDNAFFPLLSPVSVRPGMVVEL